jgi:hypothetical protein
LLVLHDSVVRCHSAPSCDGAILALLRTEARPDKPGSYPAQYG